jgi:hypothetical protein
MKLKMNRAMAIFISALALGATAAMADDCSPLNAQVDGVTNTFPPPGFDATKPPPGYDPASFPAIEVELGSNIYVHIVNLKTVFDCQKKLQPTKDIVLYLNEAQIGNLVGMQPGPLDGNDGFLRFTLIRTTPGKDAKDDWVPILGRPTLKPKTDIGVSVGFAGQFPLKSTAKKISFRTIPQIEFTIGLVFMVALFAAFIYAVYRSNILRDSTTDGVDGPGAFSLSKTQGALWFFVILGSYVLIASVTGEFNGTLTGTALTLLGIGAATAAGSAVVSASQDASGSNDKQKDAIAQIKKSLDDKDADIDRLMRELKAPPAGRTAEAIQADLAKARAERQPLERLYKKATNQSIDFINDILSDANGINFHRFQMVGWTLVLSFIFFKGVWEKLGMPDFDGNLLALQGISAATFVGLKLTEPTVPSAAKK